MEVLQALTKRIPVSAKTDYAPPSIITVVNKCIRHKISYELMERLNYTDLLYMIIDFEINEVKSYLANLERDRQSKRGVEVVEASPEMAAAFFRKG